MAAARAVLVLVGVLHEREKNKKRMKTEREKKAFADFQNREAVVVRVLM